MESADLNTSFSKLRIIKNLVVISVSFLLNFTAYDGLSMLQTTMNKEEGVGTVAQAILHSTYGISSLLVASFIIKKLGTKNAQVLGMGLYLPYVAANFYPSWITLVPSGFIIGVGVSLLWGAQCTYFNDCSVLYKSLTESSLKDTTGAEKTSTSIKQDTKELSAFELLSLAGESQSLHGTFRYIKEGSEASSVLEFPSKADESHNLPGTFRTVKDGTDAVEFSCIGNDSQNLQGTLKIINQGTEELESPGKTNGNQESPFKVNKSENLPEALKNINEGAEALRALSPSKEDEKKIRPGKFKISFETLPPDCLPSERCIGSPGLGILAETNAQNNDTTGYSKSFDSLTFKSPDTPHYTQNENVKEFKVHTTSNVRNKVNEKSKSLSSVNALFFGFHGLAYCSAQVWSNLISFYVLSTSQVDNNNKTSNCSCGAVFCNTNTYCVNSKIEEVPDNIRFYYTGVCFTCGIIALLIMWCFVDQMEKSKEKITLSWIHIFATINFSKNKEQILIIPMTVIASMVQAFFTADFTKSYIACPWSTSYVGLVSVFYGVTSAMSSIISGLLIRLFGRKIVLSLCQAMCIVSLVMLYLWIPDPQQPLVLYMAGGIYGFIVGIFHSQLKALYGVFFQGDEETAFSSCSMYSSIGWALPFFLTEFFCTSVKICFMFTIACLGLIGYLLAERSFSLRKKTAK